MAVLITPLLLFILTMFPTPTMGQEHFTLYEQKQYHEAAAKMKIAADNGDREAQYTLGKMYARGQGVDKDLQQALFYYQLAAKQNHKEAINNIGVMYDAGNGVEQDYLQAALYFKRAGQLGNETAIKNLGIMHEFGQGVEKNYAKALEYYQQAAVMGSSDVYAEIADLYRYGKGVDENKSYAIYYYKKAAEGGYERARQALAKLHDEGSMGLVNAPLPADTDAYEIPVFALRSPSKALLSEMKDNATFTYFANNNWNASVLNEELHRFALGKKNTTSVDLVNNGRYTSVVHEPSRGYSKWVLPNYYLPTREDNNQVIPFWYVFELDFFLDPGVGLDDFSLPLQLRTFLSPENVVEVSLRSNGRLDLYTEQGEQRVRHFRSHNGIDVSGKVHLEVWFALDGNWTININHNTIAAGRINNSFLINGASNHFWVEGKLNINQLTIREVASAKEQYNEFTYGLKARQLEHYNRTIAQLFEQAGMYDIEASSPEFDFASWQYQTHEHSYTRRIQVQNEEGEASDSSDRLTGYLVGLYVTGKDKFNNRITLPLQYEMFISETSKTITGPVKLFFNNFNQPYFMMASEVNEYQTKKL